MCLSQAAYQLRHIFARNSETGVEAGSGIAILGDIHNSTVPEQPDLISKLGHTSRWGLGPDELQPNKNEYTLVFTFLLLFPIPKTPKQQSLVETE